MTSYLVPLTHIPERNWCHKLTPFSGAFNKVILYYPSIHRI